ncbi:EF-hand domain-containing protein [Erythrobacteraceae bacterium CFH 75059]|uniref:EF-hand domain-containing protein n=1 Tax=Qipengyuania thermophila TaxID=2509361 RepID=UPI0010210CA8|nr:EF-hand domain-containing protein [Qipengyuania thermophila]TCD06521.1 EF-hand domain-containing protein [Erythrobacteraceae bacterium CFH 75059]
MHRFTFFLAAGSLAAAASTVAAAQPAERAPQTREAAIAQAERAFAALDANGDGVVDARDMETRRQQMFARLDTNGDGVVSRAEWDAAAAQRAQRGGDRRAGAGPRGRWAQREGATGLTREQFVAAATARFDRADANRDGTVSADERRAVREAFRTERRSGN